jgi:cysteine desulfurase/selenocysteine lyase
LSARQQTEDPGTSIQALRRDIVGIDQRVPLLDGSTTPYIFLDNAASTPAFGTVQRKVDEFLRWYSGVHRGNGFKSMVSTRAYEQSREIVARFVGADLDTRSVIFGKNTTEAVNKLANRMVFGPDDVVLCTVMEHHSNDLPWRPRVQVEYVAMNADGSLDMDDYRRKLQRFSGRAKLVSTTGASNVTGFCPPIYEMAELAHQHGAMIMADCAQLAPHRTINVGPVDSPRCLDFVALSAHKMYAPYGTGVLIGPKEFFEHGEPDYRGGGTIEIVTRDEVHWAEPPERDEAGSPNVVGAVALAAGIGVLSQVGMDAIAAHEKMLTRYALQQLNQLDGITVFGSSDPDRLDDRLGVIAFSVDGLPHGKVASILAYEGGIGVRDGCFCSHPYVIQLLQVSNTTYQSYKQRVLNRDRSDLPGMVRVSFGCYNTLDEVDALVKMLERIVERDYQGDYVVDKATGLYRPSQFDPAVFDRYYVL